MNSTLHFPSSRQQSLSLIRHSCGNLKDWGGTLLEHFIINMSYIIDQFGGSPLWKIDPPRPSTTHTLSALPRQAQREALLSVLAKQKGKFLTLVAKQDQLVAQLLILREWVVILAIKLKPQRGAVLSVRLLTPEGHPLAILPRPQRLIFCKLASVRSLEFTFQELKVQVGMGNGEVRLQSPAFHFDEMRGVERLLTATLAGLRECLLSWPIQFAREMSRTSDGAVPSMREAVTRKLYYYSQFTNIFINLTTGPTNQERSLIEQQRKETESIALLKKNYLPSSLASGQSLFSHLQAFQVGWEVSNFDISVLERDQLIEMTTLEKVTQPTTQMPYVLTHIELEKAGNDIPLKLMTMGGFSSIFLATMQYKYVQSFRVEGQPCEALKGFPPQRGPVVVKRDHPGSKISRVAHQRRILQHIKCGMARFLPSYYIVTDQGSCFADDLLMDYIRLPNLAQFQRHQRESLSLQSKIYLAVMIAQALRYLQSYRIVHLDLKPENVMLCRKLTIKLIDFGEAYHPEVKGHRPGFTPPYSAPENFFPRDDFTHKNDVFSLGVILHELLFGFAPFCIWDDSLRWRAYLRSSIHEYWLWAPEEAMNFGERTTLPILRLLIGKCLSPNPAERPELEWVMLVLRNCIQILWG